MSASLPEHGGQAGIAFPLRRWGASITAISAADGSEYKDLQEPVLLAWGGFGSDPSRKSPNPPVVSNLKLSKKNLQKKHTSAEGQRHGSSKRGADARLSSLACFSPSRSSWEWPRISRGSVESSPHPASVFHDSVFLPQRGCLWSVLSSATLLQAVQ